MFRGQNRAFIIFLVFLFFLQSCSNGKQKSGEEIAKQHCGSCHLFPSPSLLDKKTWKESILPKMGNKLGVEYFNGNYAATLSSGRSENSSIAFNDWIKIVNYYTGSAPQKAAVQGRKQVSNYSRLFEVKGPRLQSSNASCTYIKIDPGNKLVYLGSAYDSAFSVYNQNLRLIQKQKIKKVTVHLDFNEDISKPGTRTGILTNVGSFYPTEQRTGTLNRFQIKETKLMALEPDIADSLPRPIQTTVFKFDKQQKDYLVCGFGHETGGLYLVSGNGDKAFWKIKLISEIPGAIKAETGDYNNDSLLDAMVLFAHGDEGIFLFTATGNGEFEKKQILKFPPVYGSSYFEIQDMNSDGLKDIIYTCGDNYDYSRILKNFHGIYIFLNLGKNTFRKAYFFPMNGCYKAVSRDFDKDGDPDIAAISFFPDTSKAKESFIYLENKGSLRFSPFIVPNRNQGRWLTMDAGDIDSDGDDDIVLGNFFLKSMNPLFAEREDKAIPFLLLENKYND